MALQIVWTANALEDYRILIDYLIEEWSVDVAIKFDETVQNRLETISHFPYLGIVSTKNSLIRSISLSKHNRLYYRISSNTIEVLDIFDTRQNPERNKYE